MKNTTETNNNQKSEVSQYITVARELCEMLDLRKSAPTAREAFTADFTTEGTQEDDFKSTTEREAKIMSQKKCRRARTQLIKESNSKKTVSEHSACDMR